MRTLLVTSIVLAATPAMAAPCSVTLARVPTEIRAEVEAWVAQETHCNVPLEVRIVATEGGYYLLARDLHGRVRERIVPDGHSAGLLIASWAADNQLDGETAMITPALAAPAPAPIDSGPTPTAPPDRGKWFGFYGLTSSSGLGARADIDVLRSGDWTVGIAAQLKHESRLVGVNDVDTNNQNWPSPTTLTEVKLMAYAAHTLHLGDSWHLRATIGVGAELIDASISTPFDVESSNLMQPQQGITFVPNSEASLMIGAELSGGWGLAAGLLAELDLMTPEIPVTFPIYFAESPNPNTPAMSTTNAAIDRGLEISAFAGLRHRF